MIEANEISSKVHPEILEAQEKFKEIYSRFSEGVGLVTAKALYRAIINVNKAKIEFGDLSRDERTIRESEVERITSLLEEKDIK